MGGCSGYNYKICSTDNFLWTALLLWELTVKISQNDREFISKTACNREALSDYPTIYMVDKSYAIAMNLNFKLNDRITPGI